VHEDIPAATIRADEAEAFLGVVEFFVPDSSTGARSGDE
jgi:hypothetical protein